MIAHSPDSSSVIAPIMLVPANTARVRSIMERSTGPKGAKTVLGAMDAMTEIAETGMATRSHSLSVQGLRSIENC